MTDHSNDPRQHRQQPAPGAQPSHAIPLQNLPRPLDGAGQSYGDGYDQFDGSSGDQMHLPGGDGGAAFGQMPSDTNLPAVTTYWEGPYTAHAQQQQSGRTSLDSPIDPAALQFALPPQISQTGPPFDMPQITPPPFESLPSRYYDEPQHSDASGESDRVPLTTSAEPISGTLTATAEPHPRDSFQTVHDLDGSPSRSRNSRMLGFDLEPGFAVSRHPSYGIDSDTRRRSRSPSTSGALQRTASIVRAMSQRVVDISGGGEALERQARQQRSRSPSVEGRLSAAPGGTPMLVEGLYQPSQDFQTPTEKKGEAEYIVPAPPPLSEYHTPMPNPLKGKSLGIFSPDNPIRLWLCDVLVYPWTEPLILILIVLQAILLAVEAAPNVWSEGNARPDGWGGTPIDWAMLILFVVFTLEIIARVIVSGFVLNAAEYSTIDRERGVRAAAADQYRAFFKPQRQKSVKKPHGEAYGPSTFARSFTMMQGQRVPETFEENQRLQLARRAFLRHGFNRLDFVAVVSFWISFALRITGLEHDRHIYVFHMLSCLRIIRLLGITQGNAVSPTQPCNPPYRVWFLTHRTDHLTELEKVGAAPGARLLSHRLLLASVRHYRRSELQE